MAQTKLPLAKRITVNGHGETGSRAESSLRAQERAVIYYTNNSGEETAVDVESLSHAMPRTVTGTFISGDRDKALDILTNEVMRMVL